MSEGWLDAVMRAAAVGPVVRAVVVEARGSTPRDVGAWMLITHDAITETIGGGALEHACIMRAREMLGGGDVSPWQRHVERFHLGPELNQCCGGAVAILLERFGSVEGAVLSGARRDSEEIFAMRPVAAGAAILFGRAAEIGLQSRGGQDWFVERIEQELTSLFVYGAGHVGCALVRALEGLPFAVTWLDGERDGREDDFGHPKRLFEAPGWRRYDGKLVAIVECEEMAEQAKGARSGAFHVVMTHSHALDEVIVAAIVAADSFSYLGLIGSATKRARFQQRLVRAGLSQALVERIHCPIGLPGLVGKAPATIAVSVVADLLLRLQMRIDQGERVQ